MKTSRQELGRRGEDLAVRYLIARGYLIKARNWHQGRYEIDIIAQRDHEFYFIEVKTSHGFNETPWSARQAANLYQALIEYCLAHDISRGRAHRQLITLTVSAGDFSASLCHYLFPF